MPNQEPLRNASYFFLPENWDQSSGKLAVLFHGLTGSPWEMLILAEALFDNGFKVVVPCLPGHGTSIAKLRVTPLSDFLQYAGAMLKELKHAPSIIGGLSFGSLISLWCAENSSPAPQALVLLAPPFRLRATDGLLTLLSFLPERWLNSLGLRKKSDRSLPLPRSCYSEHSIAGAARLVRLRRYLVPRLKKLTMPVLIIQDPFDHHLDPDATEKAVEYFGSAEVDTVWLPRAEHELTLGPNAAEVCGTVIEFVRRSLKQED